MLHKLRIFYLQAAIVVYSIRYSQGPSFMLQYHIGYSLFHHFRGIAAERLCHLLNFSLSDEKAAVPHSSTGQRLLQKPLHGVYVISKFIPHRTLIST